MFGRLVQKLGLAFLTATSTSASDWPLACLHLKQAPFSEALICLCHPPFALLPTHSPPNVLSTVPAIRLYVVFGDLTFSLSRLISTILAVRAQKTLGLAGGSPSYDPLEAFAGPEVPARTYQYSPDGRLFAYAVPTGIHIFQAEGAKSLQVLALPNVVEINFSPRGTYISTWERPVKLEDGSQHKNLRVFSVSTGEELISLTQKSQDGWDLQYTISESHAVRLVGQEVQVFRPAEWSKGVVDKLKVEGASAIALSPGLNHSVAVFVAERKVRL